MCYMHISQFFWISSSFRYIGSPFSTVSWWLFSLLVWSGWFSLEHCVRTTQDTRKKTAWMIWLVTFHPYVKCSSERDFQMHWLLQFYFPLLFQSVSSFFTSSLFAKKKNFVSILKCQFSFDLLFSHVLYSTIEGVILQFQFDFIVQVPWHVWHVTLTMFAVNRNSIVLLLGRMPFLPCCNYIALTEARKKIWSEVFLRKTDFRQKA